jgi:hypothetical protein
MKPKPIAYNGETFPSRTALALRLAELTGRPAGACQKWLRETPDAPERVIERATRAPVHSILVVVNGRTFKSKQAFYRHLHRNYGVAAQYLSIMDLPPEAALKWAQALRKRRRQPRQIAGEVILFGWHFRSLKALCNYYGFNYDALRLEWRQAQRDGKRLYDLRRVMAGIAHQWGWEALDERNRLSPEREAKLPRSCLPLNSELDETALSPRERAALDIFQPADAMTGRRQTMAQNARLAAQYRKEEIMNHG